MNFQDCEKEVTNNGMYTVCLSIMWGTNVLCARKVTSMRNKIRIDSS